LAQSPRQRRSRQWTCPQSHAPSGPPAGDIPGSSASGCAVPARVPGSGTGTLDVLLNVAGVTGIGPLSAAVAGAGLAWIAPTGYLLAGVYALYTQWHPPALTTPRLWPARPPRDLGAALCAALTFAAALAVLALRGARDRPGDPAAT